MKCDPNSAKVTTQCVILQVWDPQQETLLLCQFNLMEIFQLKPELPYKITGTRIWPQQSWLCTSVIFSAWQETYRNISHFSLNSPQSCGVGFFGVLFWGSFWFGFFFCTKLCLLLELFFRRLHVTLADWNIRAISVHGCSCLYTHIHPISHIFPFTD